MNDNRHRNAAIPGGDQPLAAIPGGDQPLAAIPGGVPTGKIAA